MIPNRSARTSRTRGSPPWPKLALLGAGLALFGLGVFADRAWRSAVRTTKFAAAPRPTTAGSFAAAARPPSSAIIATSLTRAGLAPGAAPWRGPAAVRKAAIFALAQRDVSRALEIAATEPNWHVRELLRNAVLQGWATVNPLAAADAALELPEHERGDAIAAVLAGAVRDPEGAVNIAQHVCAADPAHALEQGRAAIEALCRVGAYAAAVRFAQTEVGENRTDWLRASFSQWSEHEPSAALKELAKIETPEAHAAAYQGLVLGWSEANAHELANYAVTLPPGEERTTGVREALAQWLARDPVAAADWIDRFEPGEEFDLGAAQIAAMPAIAKKHPDVALSWAASIVEPTLRASALASVGHDWSRTRPDQQARLMEAAKALPPADRQAVLDGIHAETTE